MKNMYDGIAILDSSGSAIVNVPAWFVALNKDFRYQLTPIGAPGPNLYVAEEISKNSFKIAGGSQGMKVSWPAARFISSISVSRNYRNILRQ
jgi:hypothetical protein